MKAEKDTINDFKEWMLRLHGKDLMYCCNAFQEQNTLQTEMINDEPVERIKPEFVCIHEEDVWKRYFDAQKEFDWFNYHFENDDWTIYLDSSVNAWIIWNAEHTYQYSIGYLKKRDDEKLDTYHKTIYEYK